LQGETNDWYRLSAFESRNQGTCGVYLDVSEEIIKPTAALSSIRTHIFAVRIIRLFMYSLNLCLFDLSYSIKIQSASNCRKNISPHYNKKSENIFHYKNIVEIAVTTTQ